MRVYQFHHPRVAIFIILDALPLCQDPGEGVRQIHKASGGRASRRAVDALRKVPFRLGSASPSSSPREFSNTLNTIYAVLLSDGSELWEATALSPDGRYIVGGGYNAASRFDEAFLLDTRLTGDVNGDGCIDDADLRRVRLAFGQTGSNLSEDINEDGIVDDADLLAVLLAFGSGC